MIQSTFLFASITNLEDKIAKLTSVIAILLCIFLYLPICMKSMKLCWTDIKILFALQRDVNKQVI